MALDSGFPRYLSDSPKMNAHQGGRAFELVHTGRP